MSLLNTLAHLLSGNHPQAPQAEAGPRLAPQLQQHMQPMQRLPQIAPQDPASQGYLPDTTYNPNPNTNLPWSSHSMALVQRMNQVMHQPLQQPGNLPFGGLQGGYDLAAQPLRPGQIPFNVSNFRDTNIGF